MKAGYLYFPLLVMLLVGCEKELDFKYHTIDPMTVIEGVLTPEEGRVSLTLSTPMGEPMDRTLLTDAGMTLEDLVTGNIFSLCPDENGEYISETGGIVGHEYRLTVQREGKEWVY